MRGLSIDDGNIINGEQHLLFENDETFTQNPLSNPKKSAIVDKNDDDSEISVQ